jgi:hypothetical protein
MSTETKTTPKTEPQASAPKQDNPFAAFDPIGYWAHVQQAFQRMAADAQGRAQAYAEQYGALEAQLVQRAQGAVATWAQLSQDAIAYGVQLSAESRKIGLEAVRKMSTKA